MLAESGRHTTQPAPRACVATIFRAIFALLACAGRKVWVFRAALHRLLAAYNSIARPITIAKKSFLKQIRSRLRAYQSLSTFHFRWPHECLQGTARRP